MKKLLKFWIAKYEAENKVKIRSLPEGYSIFNRMTWEEAQSILRQSPQGPSRKSYFKKSGSVRAPRRRCCGR